jgi:N-acetylmuramoyl-L-alanine amidase
LLARRRSRILPRVVVRGGWGWALAAVLTWVAASGAATPRELRGIVLEPTSDGTSVVIELSRPGTARFAVVRDEQGALRRIHVDLPRGTVIGGGTIRGGGSEPPVLRVRAGLVDGDHARVVIEVDGATDYRVDEAAAANEVAVTVLGAHGPPRATAADPPPAVAPAAPAPRLRRARNRPKIVLDPGHGGDDPGAQGYAIEKEITLDLARRLARLLRTRLHAEVVLTRDDDQTLALKERTARANAEDADLFVSIHANANETGRLRGIETYYLDNSTDRGTLRLAKLENGLDLLRPKNGEASLRYILSDLVQVGKLDDSVRLARSLQRGLVDRLRPRYSGIVDLGVKRGPFYVLVGAYMPCVLVETAFLTHPVEGRRLAREDYRDQVALGLYAGIARFVADLSKRRTL